MIMKGVRIMGLFSKKKKEKPEEKKQEMKVYIQGAGGSIVSKSILNGTSRLKWLFRQESEHGNGWVAFGDTDTQEYVDDANNMAIVDFNTLANMEPTVVNVFYMPVGSDLEFRSDKTGKYFVDKSEILQEIIPSMGTEDVSSGLFSAAFYRKCQNQGGSGGKSGFPYRRSGAGRPCGLSGKFL